MLGEGQCTGERFQAAQCATLFRNAPKNKQNKSIFIRTSWNAAASYHFLSSSRWFAEHEANRAPRTIALFFAQASKNGAKQARVRQCGSSPCP